MTRIIRATPGWPLIEPFLSTAGAWMLQEGHDHNGVDNGYLGFNFSPFPDMRGLSVRVGWCDLWKNGGTSFTSDLWDYGLQQYALPNAKLFQTRFMMGKWTPEAVYNQYGARPHQQTGAVATTVTGTNNAGSLSLVVGSSAGYIANQAVAVGWGGGNQEIRTISAVPDGTHLTLATGLINTHSNAEVVTQIAPVPFDSLGNPDVGLRAAYQAFLPQTMNWHVQNKVKWQHLSHYGRDFAEVNADDTIAALAGYSKGVFETATFNLINDAYAYNRPGGPLADSIFLEIPLTGFGNATDGIGVIDNDMMAYVKNTMTAGSPYSSLGGDPAHFAFGINNLDGINPGAGSGWNSFWFAHHAQMVGVLNTYEWMGKVWPWIVGVDTQGRARRVHSIEIYAQSWTGGTSNQLPLFCTRMKSFSQGRIISGARAFGVRVPS